MLRGAAFTILTVLGMIFAVAAFSTPIFEYNTDPRTGIPTAVPLPTPGTGGDANARVDTWYDCRREDGQVARCFDHTDKNQDCQGLKDRAWAMRLFYIFVMASLVINLVVGVADMSASRVFSHFISRIVMFILGLVLAALSVLSWAIAISFATTSFCDQGKFSDRNDFHFEASAFLMIVVTIIAIVQAFVGCLCPSGHDDVK